MAEPVTNPTWYGNIRNMFTQTDIDHMRNHGLDLTSYEDVVNSASGIYGQVSAGNMPPGAPWSQDWIDTFLNWMTNDFPKGTPPLPKKQPLGKKLIGATLLTKASRIRKEVTSLAPAELELLKKAFTGIMAKGLDDPNSYFKQAGYHWLPEGNLYCQHHVPAYNPWHRAYMLSFENALRSVPGCETVTLPYWDITTPFPDVLKSAPFDKYTLPREVGPGYPAGYTTQRFDYTQIQKNLLDDEVAKDVGRAMSENDWEDFHGFWSGATYNTIIAAHDSGHTSIGPTMADQGVAAFDPVFWFFHANWDRLFWKWQKRMGATTLNGLLTTIDRMTDAASYNIFTNSTLKTLMMRPFNEAPLKLDTVTIIDSENSLDVDYQDPKIPLAELFRPKTTRFTRASRKFKVDTKMVNVRVQGLNRLKIPGSFKVHLMRDEKVIATKGLFQPNEVDKCETCLQNAIVHFDFELPLETVSKGKLGVWVEPMDKSFIGDRFPHKLMGNPTVDVHFLVSTE